MRLVATAGSYAPCGIWLVSVQWGLRLGNCQNNETPFRIDGPRGRAATTPESA
jgi:hypothetical protein